MRVIAGEAKGRPLAAVKGGGTRSATDRIRETLFAILSTRVEEARVLDLFAGAGTLGIEALSRGAAHATFVERDHAALAVLRRNLTATRLADRARVVASDVIAYLDRAEGGVDLVFVDAPFADVAVTERVLAHDGLRGALSPGALMVVRTFRKARPRLPPDAAIARERELGEETLTFLAYGAPADAA